MPYNGCWKSYCSYHSYIHFPCFSCRLTVILQYQTLYVALNIVPVANMQSAWPKKKHQQQQHAQKENPTNVRLEFYTTPIQTHTHILRKLGKMFVLIVFETKRNKKYEHEFLL